MIGSRVLRSISLPNLVPSAFLVSAVAQVGERSLYLSKPPHRGLRNLPSCLWHQSRARVRLLVADDRAFRPAVRSKGLRANRCHGDTRRCARRVARRENLGVGLDPDADSGHGHAALAVRPDLVPVQAWVCRAAPYRVRTPSRRFGRLEAVAVSHGVGRAGHLSLDCGGTAGLSVQIAGRTDDRGRPFSHAVSSLGSTQPRPCSP
jgi:hypothetical protein